MMSVPTPREQNEIVELANEMLDALRRASVDRRNVGRVVTILWECTADFLQLCEVLPAPCGPPCHAAEGVDLTALDDGIPY
jgi:hypothetical protein